MAAMSSGESQMAKDPRRAELETLLAPRCPSGDSRQLFVEFTVAFSPQPEKLAVETLVFPDQLYALLRKREPRVLSASVDRK